MNRLAKPLIGAFAGVAGAALVVALFYYTALARESAPVIIVDKSPIIRDNKSVTSFAPVVKKAAPSVVNIFSTQIIQLRRYRNPFPNDPYFRQFFGDPSGQDNGNSTGRTRREQSLGSGIIISPDGYILTANHVVDGMDEIKVAIPDSKKQYTARVVGADPPTDVAVLKIDATGLPAVTFGDSDQLVVGDVALAIGNPFGVGQSVTMGIVSALGRKVESPDEGYSIQNFIQTDAAVNPGNSGGALVDAQGRLIGINTMIKSSSMGSEGIGFAVPINLARSVMDHLINDGKVSRGYLGIRMQDVDADLAQQFKLPSQNGVLVDDVMPGTPAEKAGIKAGDAIIEFNGKKIDDGNTLQLAIYDSAPGSEVTVKLVREGAAKTFTVKLMEFPGGVAQVKAVQPPAASTNLDALTGVTVDVLNRQVRQGLMTPTNLQGVVITAVNPNSNAAESGLQRGDVILEINRQPVSDAETFTKLKQQAKDKRILVRIWRRDGDVDGTRWLTVDNVKK